ncbi:methanogenesis marker 8 protein [Methanobacterium sp.]|uniref:methanogenesis marker 8 protein n=1 Tax=Methanobacterium sp. TaxID=2164 RepID=UPI003C770A03
MDKQDEHIIEAVGKTRVVIKKGKVIEVGEPKIDYCPIFDKYRGIKKLTPENVKENIEFRIKDFGMCTSNRKLRMHDFLSFGVSETLSTLIEAKIIDSVVTVCEGCGTVIIAEPDLIQGIGGRVSGLVSTSPLENVIEDLGKENVLSPENAEINQVNGVLKAIDKGYKKIAVTVVSTEDIKKIRTIEKEHKDVKIYIFVAHVSEVSKEDAETILNHADVVTGCASKYIREIGMDKGIFKAGDCIPIFGVTEEGKEFLKRRIERMGGLKEKKDAKIPKPLI